MERLYRLPLTICYLLLIYMPFHVFISQWFSTYTGGIEVWRVAKDIVLLVAVIAIIGLIFASNGFKDKQFWIFEKASLAFLVVFLLVWWANPGIDSSAALISIVENARLFAFALLGWGALLLLKTTNQKVDWQIVLRDFFRITVIVSTVVSILAIIQFSLPQTTLSHFGYSQERGVNTAYFADQEETLPQARSTLLGPDSLGVYLILPITLLVIAWFRRPRARILVGGMLLLNGWAMILTFSWRAWIGLAVSLTLLAAWAYRRQLKLCWRRYKRWIIALTAWIAVMIPVLLSIYKVNVGYPGQTLNEVFGSPLGNGPGTSSNLAQHDTILSSNYFLQLIHEAGIQGFILFVVLSAFVIWLLLKRRDGYSLSLIASFAGIGVSALFMPAWANESIAAQWWLLAGVVIAASGFLAAGHGAGQRQPQKR